MAAELSTRLPTIRKPYGLLRRVLAAFMQHCAGRIGDAYFRTPRNTIKEFVNLLAVLDQNPGADWRQLLGNVSIDTETNPDLEPLSDEIDASDPNGTDELTSLRI